MITKEFGGENIAGKYQKKHEASEDSCSCRIAQAGSRPLSYLSRLLLPYLPRKTDISSAFMDDLMVDRLEILGVTRQQSLITNNINKSEVAPGKGIYLFERLACENLPLSARDTQTVLHILGSFRFVQRPNIMHDCDSFPQSPTFRPYQSIVEFLLPYKEYI
jgi:hypothetical protein